MAKKGGNKEGAFWDSTSTSSVELKMTTESSKQKIAKIHDIFPSATKDQISKVLQYYDDDESQALDALTRDGGQEALSNLSESGSVKSKNNKNKKKKKKGKKESDLAGSGTASFDADDSSSLHSSGNVDTEVEKECESRNGIPFSSEEVKDTLQERLNTPETDASSSGAKECAVSESVLEASQLSSVSDPKISSSTEQPACDLPTYDTFDKQEDPNSKKEKYKSFREENYSKHTRPRTSSFRRMKTSSFSEDVGSTYNPQSNTAIPTKRGYEKCKKDLNRQTISLQRIHSQVERGLEESSKKLKNSINDLRKLLDKRQEQLEQQLAKTKEDALTLLKSRQDMAVELKRRVDRTSSLTEAEWSELRSDVKQFVTERKYDDELGKTIWFQWSMDSITEVIKNFGEVHPVKNVYSQRSHSALGNVVSQSNPQPSPSSSLANEEISSAADKNDVADILDTAELESTGAKKEAPPPVPRTQLTEGRSRVFSNTNMYQKHNRGGNRGGYRGNRGYGGYSRPNNQNNMGYNRTYYDYPNDHRSHPPQERDRGTHHNPIYSSDRNVNRYQNNRNDRRGHSHYRGHNRYRGSQHRQNENIPKTEPASNESPAVEGEKSTVVNGFDN